MKLRRISVILIVAVLLLTTVVSLVACNGAISNNNELNIVDDNYRNYYEIFVRSFWDSGDDGIGDLKGVTHQLDYIKEMGFNGIWLMPIMESTSYHGYDVVDYYTVESDYGTNEDFKELTEEAHKRGIKVIIDMVINHSSNANEWFEKACTALAEGKTNEENAKYVDWYNFQRSCPDKDVWRPVDGVSGLFYEGRFDTKMPDLNLDNQEVKDEITKIFKFWLTDMDCDGFRLDAVTNYYTGNVSENIKFLSWINETAKSIKDDAYIVGEAWEGTDGQIREYYESGCDSFFQFTISAGASSVSPLRTLLFAEYSDPGERFERLLLSQQETYDIGILAPFLCNHDTARAANMLGFVDYVKMGAGLMSMMNGSVFVYYGDEIGMTSASSLDETKRVPMKWVDAAMAEGQVFASPYTGFRVADSSYSFGSVESQQADEASILNYYKNAMRIRNKHPEIARGTIETMPSVSPCVATIKKTWNNQSIIILINLSKEESFKIKLSDYGDVKAVDSLDVNEKSSVSGNTLTITPYSIVVLK